jgi:hypothetical protein
MKVAQTSVEIGQILERLNGKNGIKLGGVVRRRQDIPRAAFDPREIGAPRLSRRDLVGADVERADPVRLGLQIGQLRR